MGTRIDFPGADSQRPPSEANRVTFASGTNPLVLSQAREIGKKLENIRHHFFVALGTASFVMAELNMFELEHFNGIVYITPVDLRAAISDALDLSINLKFLIEETEKPGLVDLRSALESLCEVGNVLKALVTESANQPGQEWILRDALVRREMERLMKSFGEIMTTYILSDYIPKALRSQQ